MSSIFVQIAAYRDRQLLPTIRDCIATAHAPQALRFGICWQRDETETLAEFADDPRFRILDIPYTESQGACWARRQIQDLYEDETYTLQIDAHQRFAPQWDRQLIEMLEATGSTKPLLSSYVPHFDPETGERHKLEPSVIVPSGFDPNGIMYLAPGTMEDFETLESPPPARFCAAGLIFSLGRFCRDVRYDPQLYFLGEEISTSVRAFTHGYDLFHPHRGVLWHYYAEKRRRHWDDHTGQAGSRPWQQFADRSNLRIMKLLRIAELDLDLGEYGLGPVRSLEEYQDYAGVHFRLRAVHPDARGSKPPPTLPIPANDEEWGEYGQRWFAQRIPVDERIADPPDDLAFWRVWISDRNGQQAHREDLDPPTVRQILEQKDPQFLVRYRSVERGKSWTVEPHSLSKGPLERATGDC